MCTSTTNLYTLLSSTPSTTPPPITYILLDSHSLPLEIMFIIIKYFIDKTASVWNEGVKSAFPQLFWEQLVAIISIHQSHKHCGNGHSHKPCRNGILWQIMQKAVGFKKFWVLKNFWSKKGFGSAKFLLQKIYYAKKIISQKKVVVKIKFSPK